MTIFSWLGWNNKLAGLIPLKPAAGWSEVHPVEPMGLLCLSGAEVLFQRGGWINVADCELQDSNVCSFLRKLSGYHDYFLCIDNSLALWIPMAISGMIPILT